MATFHTHPDRDDERAGADRRRHGADARGRQGRARGGASATRACSTVSSSSATRTASSDYRELVRVDAVGATSCEGSGIDEADDPRACRLYIGVRAGDHRLVPRRHPTRARRRHDPRDRQPAAAARQHRPRRRRSLPDPRPQQRAGQPDLRDRQPPRRGLPRPARARSAGSIRRASTGSAPSRRSRRCTRGDVKVFVALGGNFALAAPDTRLHRSTRCAIAS